MEKVGLMIETKTLKWYRSWPNWWGTEPPEHLKARPYVWDTLPRIHMEGWNYKTAILPSEDFVLVEWDIAIDGPNKRTFTKRALRQPTRVHTIPYFLNDGRLIDGFGCVYLPREQVVKFLNTVGHYLFSDTTFFDWYGRENIVSHNDLYVSHLNSWGED